MESHICPFCNQAFIVNEYCFNKLNMELAPMFPTRPHLNHYTRDELNQIDIIHLHWYICPQCKMYDISCRIKIGDELKDIQIYPSKNDNHTLEMVNCVPKSIMEDYVEARSILNLSPKASATLSRRCIQGMIRDFWKIKNKKTLMEEINSIPQEKLTSEGREALHALRNIGNIGAHPEKMDIILDVESDEADKMLELVEFFIDNWYIKNYKEKNIFDKVKLISENKKQIRNSYSNNNISNSNNIAFGENSTVIDDKK